MKKISLAILSLVFLFPAQPLHAEDVNLSTYYPSPYGSYQELRIEESSGALGIFTGGVTQAGLRIISDLATGDFMPGIFWTTTDDNPEVPKAGIWMHEDTSGTELYFGTSSNNGSPTAYSEGLNNFRPFGMALADAAPAMVLDQFGRLGLGRADPMAQFHVESDTSIRMAHFAYYSGNRWAPTITLLHARGTHATPALLQAGDYLGDIQFAGSRFNAGFWTSIEPAAIGAEATANWTNTSWPTRLTFRTSAASGSFFTERMRITEDGALELIGLASDPAVSTAASGTIPETAKLYYNTASNQIMVSQEGSAYASLGGGAGGASIEILKTTTESVTSSATLQLDDALKFSVGASETWEFDFFIIFENAAGGEPTGIKLSLSGPALGGTGWISAMATGSSGDSTAWPPSFEPPTPPVYEKIKSEILDDYVDAPFFGGVSPWGMHWITPGWVRLSGAIKTGGTSGTVSLEWAQGASSVRAIRVLRGSRLKAKKF